MRTILSLFFCCLVSLTFAEPASIDSEISRINERIRSEKFPISTLSKDQFVEWLRTMTTLSLEKEIRSKAIDAADQGLMAQGFQLRVDLVGAAAKPQVYLAFEEVYGPVKVTSVATFADARGIRSDREKIVELSDREKVCDDSYHLCDETDLVSPTLVDRPFPKDLPVEVIPMQIELAPGSGPERSQDALQVRIQLTRDNRDAVIEYFGSFWPATQIAQRVDGLMKGQESAWVDLQGLFPGWVGPRVNTYPDYRVDNDVCYHAAREFFFEQQTPKKHGYARSTEAIESMLVRHYCLVRDTEPPQFGDLLYWNGHHSGRYVLRDPATGRDVSFSVQSGGGVPFRFYWLDEDFSGKPFDHRRVPNVLKRRIDVWRRCH